MDSVDSWRWSLGIQQTYLASSQLVGFGWFHVFPFIFLDL